MSSASPATSRARRLIVTLQLGGVFFALANIICVAILAWTYVHVKLEPKTIEVKGSAKKAITSDLISWSGTITARDAELPKAYDKLKADADRLAAFLKDKGVPDKEITFSSITTEKMYQKEAVPNGRNGEPTIIQTNKIEMYVLTQTVTVESTDMKRVPEVARNVTTLIKDDVEIDSGSPRYLYTKLSELKIDMLAEATKDATTRATQIVTNANGSLGRLVEAKMGVMQINPKGSSATSAEGNNDTTSLEKEITAVVTARYEVQ
jgi:uncharacterized protein